MKHLIAGLACLAAAIGPSSASAQTTRQFDLAAGYLKLIGPMHGGNVQAAAELTERWSVIGEADWSKGRDCIDCDPVYTDVAVLAGFRAQWLRNTKVSPFAQVLVGGLNSRAGAHYQDYCSWLSPIRVSTRECQRFREWSPAS